MMEILKNQTRDILTAWFPSCHVQFETLGEDPNVIGVGVYGVPKPLVKWVKKKIHESQATQEQGNPNEQVDDPIQNNLHDLFINS